MKTLVNELNKVNLGHVLTIVAMIGSAFIFFSRFESRLSVVETNVEWLVKVTSIRYQTPPPAAK